MFSILAFLIGLVSLVIVIPATLPFFGALNWLALPLIIVGVIVGQLSSSKSGRNFCLIVLLVGIQMGLDLFVRPNDIFMIAPGIAD